MRPACLCAPIVSLPCCPELLLLAHPKPCAQVHSLLLLTDFPVASTIQHINIRSPSSYLRPCLL